ncbi:hypothetical protein GCM10011609_84820 [Lentzea pudingi]|uniref:Uncharacterized protein n=1 Tax=Lentzea pudingi TaxID=1789439 RepID=A0ABQ2IWF9_9PSEU|nr:hypothetical protein GCM10011609_84820 [Lentzea pudingi]
MTNLARPMHLAQHPDDGHEVDLKRPEAPVHTMVAMSERYSQDQGIRPNLMLPVQALIDERVAAGPSRGFIQDP